MKTRKKITPYLIILACIFALLYYYPSFIDKIIYSLYYFFYMMLDYTIVLYGEGEYTYGTITLILQLLAWLIFVFIMKVTVFNALFPKIRIVDALKNDISYARKVKLTKGDDSRFIYMKVKFKFFPIFRWHTFKVPKPEFTSGGLPFSRKRIAVANGNKGVEWRRMPSSLDIVTDTINIEWNEKEEAYQLTPEHLERMEENVIEYRNKSSDTIRRLSQNVNESVRGDASLLKDQYQTGIPISMDAVVDKDDRDLGLEPVPYTNKPALKELKDLEVLSKDIPEDELEGMIEGHNSEEVTEEVEKKIKETNWKNFEWS